MKITRLMIPALIFAGSLGSAAHAESAVSADPVLASFQRLLAHQPGQTPATLPANLGADPLRASISVVLWEKRETSFHLLADSTPVSARSATRD